MANPYLSELRYRGDADVDFVEIAVDAGADVTNLTVAVHSPDGSIKTVSSLNGLSPDATVAGKDVYVIENGVAGFNDLWLTHAVALSDSGTVFQFVSFEGNSITATGGDANGLTSTNIGTAGYGFSLETTDGGASYAVQGSPNAGTIPICFAAGTRISTPNGVRRVEGLRPGDLVSTLDSGPQPVIWIGCLTQRFRGPQDPRRPVVLKAHCLERGVPHRDLVISPQHRIMVRDPFGGEALTPAKALLQQPGVRVKRGLQEVAYVHILLSNHAILVAEGVAAETLLLNDLTRSAIKRLRGSGMLPDALNHAAPARPLLTVGKLRQGGRHFYVAVAPTLTDAERLSDNVVPLCETQRPKRSISAAPT